MSKAFGSNIQRDRPLLEALAIQQSDRSHSLLIINKSSQATQVELTETNIFKSGKTQLSYLDASGVKVNNLSGSNIPSLRLKPYSVLLLHRH